MYNAVVLANLYCIGSLGILVSWGFSYFYHIDVGLPGLSRAVSDRRQTRSYVLRLGQIPVCWGCESTMG